MVCYYIRYQSKSTILWISLLVNSSDFALRATTGQEGWDLFLPCCLPSGKAGELQILCCQEFEVVVERKPG
jgi:hypothetical protein